MVRALPLLLLAACGGSTEDTAPVTTPAAKDAAKCIDEFGRDTTYESSHAPAADDCNDAGLSEADCDYTQWITLESALCIAGTSDVITSALLMWTPPDATKPVPAWHLTLTSEIWYIDARNGVILKDSAPSDTGTE
jgi:hypothetical protein